jgi:uncharacterized membrane protein SpoIIM required for sporulation
MGRRLVLLAMSACVMFGSAAVPLLFRAAPAESSRTVRLNPAFVEGSREDFVRIVIRNQALCLLTASGLMTGGLTAVASLGAVSFQTAHGIVQLHARTHAPALVVVALLAPHGVFELAGLLLAGAAGLGGFPLALFLSEGRRQEAIRAFRQGLAMQAGAIVLILVAAVVEVAVTPRIVGLVWR